MITNTAVWDSTLGWPWRQARESRAGEMCFMQASSCWVWGAPQSLQWVITLLQAIPPVPEFFFSRELILIILITVRGNGNSSTILWQCTWPCREIYEGGLQCHVAHYMYTKEYIDIKLVCTRKLCYYLCKEKACYTSIQGFMQACLSLWCEIR